MEFISKRFLFMAIPFIFSACQQETSQQSPQLNNNLNSNQNSVVKPSVSPKPKPSVSPSPSAPDDNEIVGTDTEVVKTNVNWKEYNPVVKGKKYTYTLTMKEGDSTIQSDILREITEVEEKSYKIKQSILTSGSNESQLRAIDLSVTLNSDNSPSVIPVTSVGGEKISPTSQIEITEKPEKLKVPFGEFDSVKVVSKSGTNSTTNWYGKNIGLVKAAYISGTSTYTLELKDYK